MGKEREIADCIKALAGVPDVPYIYCIAKNVSETDFTCDGEPVMGDAKITGIKLVAKVGENNSVVVIPEADSLILVAMTSKTDGFMVQCDKAKKLLVKVGNSTIEITSDEIKMNGGDNKGLVEVDKMVSWMQKVHTDLTTLQTILLSHPVAGSGAPLALTFTPQTPTPEATNFENTKVKH
ncbi:MAG: hypothetical protein WCO84_06635 [bacterium]